MEKIFVLILLQLSQRGTFYSNETHREPWKATHKWGSGSISNAGAENMARVGSCEEGFLV